MAQNADAHQNGPDHVDIRWLDVTTVADDAWRGLERLIDAEERARAGRFHFERDRKTYIAAHALMRTMLSERLPKPPAEWQFTTNKQGKPEAVVEADEPWLRVNLSHTTGLVAVALTHDNDIGIDVEWRLRRGLGLDIADRYFAPAEVETLNSLSQEHLKDGLFAFWTLKEAMIKAVGLGLSMPLDSFAFNLEPLSVAFADGQEKPGPWLFERFEPTPEHAMALALRHPDPASVRIAVRRAEPSALLAYL